MNGPAATVSWEPGDYRLDEIVVLRPSPVDQAKGPRKRFQVLSACGASGMAFSPIGFPELHRSGPPTTAQLENPDEDRPQGIPNYDWGGISVQVSQKYWTDRANRFEIPARASQRVEDPAAPGGSRPYAKNSKPKRRPKRSRKRHQGRCAGQWTWPYRLASRAVSPCLNRIDTLS